MNDVALVVMERGSFWPEHVASTDDVIAFCPDESSVLRHTEEKLDALRNRSRAVRVAVLACNEQFGAVSAGRRAGVARALLGAVTEGRCGTLVLTASLRASQSLRFELLTLADELTRGLPPDATVSLHFAAPEGATS